MQELHLKPPDDALVPLEKVSSGVPGLDNVLHGGLPKSSPSLIFGGPGTGKTLLGFSFVKACQDRGEPAVFASFEQASDDVRRHAKTVGIDLAAAESLGLVAIAGSAIPAETDTNPDSAMAKLYEDIAVECDRIGARHIVLDGLDLYVGILRDPGKERTELVFIRRWAMERGMTVLATAKAAWDRRHMETFGDFVNYGVDCAIRVFHDYQGHAFARKLEVIKYRGSGFLAGQHPIQLGRRGFVVAPLPRISLRRRVSTVPFSSGNAAFDRILGGGLLRGSTSLIVGPSGSGKSTFAEIVARAALERGERVLRLSFESPSRMLDDIPVENVGRSQAGGREPGVNSGWEATGLYRIVSVLPESVNPEDLLIELLDTMNAFKPDLLIVDSTSACRRMGSERTAHAFLIRLIGQARLAGTTRLLTHLAEPGHADLKIDGNNMNPQVATIVRLDLSLEHDGLKRHLLVVKCRGCAHSPKRHGFKIHARGVEFLPDEHAAPDT